MLDDPIVVIDAHESILFSKVIDDWWICAWYFGLFIKIMDFSFDDWGWVDGEWEVSRKILEEYIQAILV